MRPKPSEPVEPKPIGNLAAPEPAQQQVSHAWRVAFDEPATGAPAAREAWVTEPVTSANATSTARPAGAGATAAATATVRNATTSTMSDPFATLRKRIALLLGFAYLMLYALASGLSLYLPLTANSDATGRGKGEDSDAGAASGAGGGTVEHPTLHGTPSQTDYCPRPHPRLDPHAPGLHVRPDGSRYLIVPLNFAGAAA